MHEIVYKLLNLEERNTNQLDSKKRESNDSIKPDIKIPLIFSGITNKLN